MPTTRSSRLAAGIVPTTGAVTIFTCPDDEIVIVKSATLSNFTQADQVLELRARDPAGTFAPQISKATVQAGSSLEWSGWVVLEAGDQLVIVSQAVPTVVYWVSGTRLATSSLNFEL